MANTKSANSFSTLRFLSQPQSKDPTRDADPFELDESDVVWSFPTAPPPSSDHPPKTNGSPPQQLQNHRHQTRQNQQRRFYPSNYGLTAALSNDDRNMPAAARFEPHSAPVSIPTWSKELMVREERRRFDDVAEEGDESGDVAEEMVPPHVIVARSHVTFSVFEGVGRTLKGRDLRRVRNAVFQKTGFID